MAAPCQGHLDSSNGFGSEEKLFPDREVGREPRSDITSSDQPVIDAHPSQEQTPHSPRDQRFPDKTKGNDSGDLRYICQILMEEQMDGRMLTIQESDLQRKERSLYELLGEKYQPSPQQKPALDVASGPRSEATSSGEQSVDGNSFHEHNAGDVHLVQDEALPDESRSHCDSSTQILRYIDQMLMEENWEDQTDAVQESLDFEAKFKSFYEVLDQKYPPPPEQDSTHHSQSEISGVSPQNPEEGKNNAKNPPTGARGKKNNRQGEADDGEDEINKFPPVQTDFNNGSAEEFDDLWIYTDGGRESKLVDYIRKLRISASKKMQESRAKGRPPISKKQNSEKEVVDLTSLLISCSHSVGSGDHRALKELLQTIRRHSSPYGDGNQRLAHYFANGLEARMAGTGGRIYRSLVYERKSSSDYLRANCLSLVSSSFYKTSTLISNKLIIVRSEKAARVHIIDFGILYGFHWPAFIRRLAEREGGPPLLRITGIDFPHPGPWPAQQTEETGHRLAAYANMFGVPFKFNAIARAWQTVRMEDLKMEEGELVVVNCLYNSKYLLTEEIAVESPRTMFLDLVRRIDPDFFVHGVVNVALCEPYFVPRFREVLFHYSALFDMMETIVPRENRERMVLESHLGREVFNVIACENWERIERPETYKQWQVRHLEAGFVQVPFGRDLVDIAMQRARSFCHRDFRIDEDKQWLLMSWKGRILCAMSCWQPVRRS